MHARRTTSGPRRPLPLIPQLDESEPAARPSSGSRRRFGKKRLSTLYALLVCGLLLAFCFVVCLTLVFVLGLEGLGVNTYPRRTDATARRATMRSVEQQQEEARAERAQLRLRQQQREELVSWLTALDAASVYRNEREEEEERWLPLARKEEDTARTLARVKQVVAAAAAAAAVHDAAVGRPGSIGHFASFYRAITGTLDEATIQRLAQGMSTVTGAGAGEEQQPAAVQSVLVRDALPGFARVAGASFHEHKRLRALDELELLKYRYALLREEVATAWDSNGVEPVGSAVRRLQRRAASQDLKQALYATAPSVLNRLYYFPLQRFERFAPYTTETVRGTDAWFTPIAAELLHQLGAATFVGGARDDNGKKDGWVGEPTAPGRNAYLYTADPYLPLSLMQNELRFLSKVRLSEVVVHYNFPDNERFLNRANSLENVGNVAPLFTSVMANGAVASGSNVHLWRLFKSLRTDDDDDDEEEAGEGEEAVLQARARTRQRLDRFLMQRKQSARDEASIFVSMAAYRDVECAPTLYDLFQKAKNPQRVSAGIAEQNRDGDPSCLQQVLLFPPLPCFRPSVTSLSATHNEKERGALSLVLAGPRTVGLAQTQRARAIHAAERGDDYELRAQHRAYGVEEHSATPATTTEMEAATAPSSGRPFFPLPRERATVAPYDPYFSTSSGSISGARQRARTAELSAGLCFVGERVRSRRIRAGHAFGPTFGRYMAMLLYRGESLTVILDSHNRFTPFWDSLGVNAFLKYNDERVGLSHYPEGYAFAQDNGANEQRVALLNEQRRVRHNAPPLDAAAAEDELQVGARLRRSSSGYLCQSEFCRDFGYVRLRGILVGDAKAYYGLNGAYLAPYYRPAREEAARHALAVAVGDPERNAQARAANFRLPQPWVAGGFLLTSYHLFRDVPFDPNLPHIFDGEEVLLSMRLWTHGFTLFSPDVGLCYHFYSRPSAPKVWTEVSAFYRVQAHTRRRVQYLLRAHANESAVPLVQVRRNVVILADKRSPDAAPAATVLVDSDRYGMGRVRAVQQWYDFAGIDPIHHTIDGRFCGG